MAIKTGATTVEISVSFLKKVEINCPAFILLDIYLKGSMSYYRDTFSFTFIAILFTVTRKWK